MTLPHETITSPSNPRVREAARLREADARRATGLAVVDGRRELSRAAAAGVEIVEVFLDADAPSDPARDAWLAPLAARGTRVTALASRAFEKIAFGSRNEGLVGVVRFAARPLDVFHVTADRPVLVVEGVEKPGNLGAVLRTADAAGIAGVIASGAGTDPANPAAIRASLGTVFTVPLAVTTSAAAIEWCGRHGRRVIAAMPDGTLLWHKARLAGATAIVLGSEARGLSPAWQVAADAGQISLDTVRLPMLGIADSLNVSATAAILAYEALRQMDMP
ncbi:MAG: TrmH family RNA methyltransferase [Planctomycetia bacterium]|jgi:TrmH family RNA methyltransferase